MGRIHIAQRKCSVKASVFSGLFSLNLCALCDTAFCLSILFYRLFFQYMPDQHRKCRSQKRRCEVYPLMLKMP